MGLQILVVEDTPIHQKVTRAQLAQIGFVCDVVTNGRDAIEALHETSYSAILMDIRMPVMDGYETTRAIRELEKSESLPWKCPIYIFALTGCAMPRDREKGLVAGMDGYLTRPLSFKKLQAELEKVISISSHH